MHRAGEQVTLRFPYPKRNRRDQGKLAPRSDGRGLVPTYEETTNYCIYLEKESNLWCVDWSPKAVSREG